VDGGRTVESIAPPQLGVDVGGRLALNGAVDPEPSLHENAAASDFLAQYLDDAANGQVRSLAEYQARFPTHAARIATEYATLTRAPVASAPEPEGAAASSWSGRIIGPYRLLARLGSGGQGVVFAAEHLTLRRRAALKVLHPNALGLDGAQRARLRREATTLARLDHPSICAIHDVDLDGEPPWLAMRLVDGESLATLLERAGAGDRAIDLPPRDAAAQQRWFAFFEQAAAGLHVAHAAGIVHRDIKPANLMRRPDGDPVLVDFGLARDASAQSALLTQPQEQFGTLLYMAPERLDHGAEPDPRADIYALGVSAYETLTAARPFTAPTPLLLRQQIATGDHPPVRRHNPTLSGDAETVLATAMARDPDRRYATARAFADDLRRLRLGEPIAARPAGRLERAQRWIARHPRISLAFALVLLGLIATTLLLLEVRATVTDLERSNRELAAVRAAHQAVTLARVAPSLALADAVAAARVGHSPEIADLLLETLAQSFTEHLVVFRAAEAHRRTFCNATVTADGKRAATPLCQGFVPVVEVATGALLQRIPTPPGAAFAAFVASGELVIADADGTLAVGRPHADGYVRDRVLLAAGPAATALAADDAGRVALADASGTVQVCPLTEAGPAIACCGHARAASLLAFAANGRWLASLSRQWHFSVEGDDTVRVFDPATGHCQWTFAHPAAAAPEQMAWSPSGHSLFVAWEDGRVSCFAIASGTESWHTDVPAPAASVAFDAQRSRLLVGGRAGLSALDPATGRVEFTVDDFGDRSVCCIAHEPRADRYAVLAHDGRIRILTGATLGIEHTLREFGRPTSTTWVAGGERLLTVYGTTLAIQFAGSRPFLPELIGHRDRVEQVSFDGAGRRVLTASRDGTARLFASDGRELAILHHDGAVQRARFAAAADDDDDDEHDDGRVVTTAANGAVHVWSGAGQPLATAAAHGARDAWLRAGDRLVSITSTGHVRCFDAATGAPRAELHAHPGAITCAAWHPTRDWLATGGNDRSVVVVDCEQMVERWRSAPWPWGGSDSTGRAVHAWAPDGERLVGAGADQRLHCWSMTAPEAIWHGAPWLTVGFLAFGTTAADLLAGGLSSSGLGSIDSNTGKVVATPFAPDNVICQLACDPGRQRALCADKGGRVAIFDAGSRQPRIVIRASTKPLLDAAFNGDGSLVVTADTEGRVRIWPVDPLPVAERHLPRVHTHD
jgi:eukaryotic-like serine/threonine-protein kinase